MAFQFSSAQSSEKPGFTFQTSGNGGNDGAKSTSKPGLDGVTPSSAGGFSFAQSKPASTEATSNTPVESKPSDNAKASGTTSATPQSEAKGFSFSAVPAADPSKAKSAGSFSINSKPAGDVGAKAQGGGFNFNKSDSPKTTANSQITKLPEEDTSGWADHMLATNEQVLASLLGGSTSTVSDLLGPDSFVVKRLKNLFSHFKPSTKESLKKFENDPLPIFEGCKSSVNADVLEIEFVKRLSPTLPTAAVPTGLAKISWASGGLDEVHTWQAFRSFLRHHFSLSSAMEIHFDDNWLNDTREFVWRERVDLIRLLIAIEIHAADKDSPHNLPCSKCLESLDIASHTTFLIDHIEAASELLHSYISETARSTRLSMQYHKIGPNSDPTRGPWVNQLLSELNVMLELMIVRYYSHPSLASLSHFRRFFDLMMKHNFYALDHHDFPFLLNEGVLMQEKADNQLAELHQKSVLVFFAILHFVHFFEGDIQNHTLLETIQSKIPDFRNLHSRLASVTRQQLEREKAETAKLLVVMAWSVFIALSLRELASSEFDDAIAQAGDLGAMMDHSTSNGALEALERCASQLVVRRKLFVDAPSHRLSKLVSATSLAALEEMIDQEDTEGISGVELATHASVFLEFLSALVEVASPQDQDPASLATIARSTACASHAHPLLSKLFWQRWARWIESGDFGNGLSTFADPLVLLLHVALSSRDLRLEAAYGVVASLIKNARDADVAFYILYERGLWTEVATTFTSLQFDPASPPLAFLSCSELICALCSHMTDVVAALETSLPGVDLRVLPNTCVRFICSYQPSRYQPKGDGSIWRIITSCCTILRMLIDRSDHTFTRVVIEEILDANGALFGNQSLTQSLHHISTLDGVPDQYRLDVMSSINELTRAVVRHTTSPTGTADLHVLFNRFDTDGNKTLDKSEFANGLAAMGYRLSHTAINQLFRKFDSGEGDNVIDYDEFIQFAISSQQQSNLAEAVQDYARAPTVEAELRQLMQSLMRPDGVKALREVELCASLCSTAVATLTSSSLRRWKPSEKPAILFPIVRIFRQLLYSDVTDVLHQAQDANSALSNLRHQVVVRFIQDGEVRSSFLNALASLNSNVLVRKNVRGSLYARDIHQSLTVRQIIQRGAVHRADTVSSGAHLPFDFSSGFRTSGSVETTESQKVILEAMVEESLLLLIELYVRVARTDGSDAAFLMSAVSMLGLPVEFDHSSPLRGAVAHRTPFNFLIAIASLLEYPNGPSLRQPHPLPLLALKALTAFATILAKLEALVDEKELDMKVHSFLDYLGIENLEPFRDSLCRLLNAKSELSSVRGAAFDLLITFVEHHPVFAKMLFCEPDRDVVVVDQAKTESSKPIPELATYKLGENSLLHALTKGVLSRDLLSSDPWLLSKAYNFVHAIWTHRGRGRLYLAAIGLASSSTFWEALGWPLMTDLEAPPDFDVKEIAAFTDDRELKPRFGDEGSKMSTFCAKVQCRAWALQILSIEQHEHFQHERGPRGVPNGSDAAEQMRVWLKQAQEKARPRAWLNQYLSFSLDPNLLPSLLFQSREVGYDLSAYRVPSHLVRFGENFIFNINALRLSMGNTLAEEKLLEAAAAANHALSLADVQEKLIAAWKRFMESWVASAARLKVSKSARARLGQQSHERAPSVCSMDSPTSEPPSPASILTGQSATESSEFKGDLRSYAVAKQVSTLLSQGLPQLDGISNPGKLGVVLNELAELLSSMLHHQLFVVKKRHADPLATVAVVRPETRLENIDKCFQILLAVNATCSKYFEASNIPNLNPRLLSDTQGTFMLDLNFFVQFRMNILTSALILVLIITSATDKIDEEEMGEPSDGFAAKQDELQKIFNHATESIQWASEVTKATEQHETKEVSPCVKGLAHLQSVCECLLTTLLTNEHSSTNRWKSTSLIRCIFTHLSSTSTDAAHEYRQSHDMKHLSLALHNRRLIRSRRADDHNKQANDPFESALRTKRMSPSSVTPRGAPRMNALIVFLQSVSQKPDLTVNLMEEGLIPLLTHDSLFSTMLKECQQTPLGYSHVLGYAASGEPSPANECWHSLLRFMTLLVTSTINQNYADSSHSTLHEASLRTATQFITHFRSLLEAPFRCSDKNEQGRREARVSLVQLTQAETTLRFLSAMAADSRTWRAFAPDQPALFRTLILQCICDWTVLLGDGSSESQGQGGYEKFEGSLLHSCADEISQDERTSKNKKRTVMRWKKAGSNVRGIVRMSAFTPKAQSDAPKTPTKPPISRSISAASVNSEGKDDSDEENFFSLVEQGLVDCVHSGLTFLRTLSPLSPPARHGKEAPVNQGLPDWLIPGTLHAIRQFGIAPGTFVRTLSVEHEEPVMKRWCVLAEQRHWNDQDGQWDATYTAVSEDMEVYSEILASHIYLIERTEASSIWFQYSLADDASGTILTFDKPPSVHHLVQIIQFVTRRLKSAEVGPELHEDLVMLAETAVWMLVVNVEAHGRMQEMDSAFKLLGGKLGDKAEELRQRAVREKGIDDLVYSVLEDVFSSPSQPGLLTYLSQHGEDELCLELVKSSQEVMRRLQDSKARGATVPQKKRSSFGGKNPLLYDDFDGDGF